MIYKKPLRKNLFENKQQAEIFVSLFDNERFDELDRKIARHIFVDNMTVDEVADIIGYSSRQIERIKSNFIRFALQKLIHKQTPQESKEYDDDWFICPNCGSEIVCVDDYIDINKFCLVCGQALNFKEKKVHHDEK